jgi:hypothetical protein
VLRAYKDFVRTFLFAKRTALAKSAMETAVKVYAFDENESFKPLFDPAQTPSYLKPVPPDPVFYKPAPMKFELLMPEVQDQFEKIAGKGTINEVKVEIVEGRAQYYVDAFVNGKTHRIRVSEEGKLLEDKAAN